MAFTVSFVSLAASLTPSAVLDKLHVFAGTDTVCKLAMQVLCNIALSSHAGAAAVWSAAFPSALRKVAETRSGASFAPDSSACMAGLGD
jgi:hypothetical protein